MHTSPCFTIYFLVTTPFSAPSNNLRSLCCGFSIGQLLGLAGGPSLQTRLGTVLTGIGLVGKSLLLSLDRLHFVDGLNQDTLVLELVTLGEHVKGMVNVLVNFLSITHLLQKTPEDSGAAHPDDLEGKTSVGGTCALTGTYWDKQEYR